MAYNALKSLELTNFVNVLMFFLVSCSNGGGKTSPVRTMVFRRILLSVSSCVQFKIICLIVCSSFSPQGHVELGIILNLWRYDLVKPWPVTIAVHSAQIGIMVFILSFMYGKNNLLTAPFVELVHCSCYFVISFSFPSLIIVSLGTLSYTDSPVSSVATFLARRSAISIPCIPTCAFNQFKITFQYWPSTCFIFFLIFPISM